MKTSVFWARTFGLIVFGCSVSAVTYRVETARAATPCHQYAEETMCKKVTIVEPTVCNGKNATDCPNTWWNIRHKAHFQEGCVTLKNVGSRCVPTGTTQECGHTKNCRYIPVDQKCIDDGLQTKDHVQDDLYTTTTDGCVPVP